MLALQVLLSGFKHSQKASFAIRGVGHCLQQKRCSLTVVL